MTAVVTGASGGVGREVTQMLLARGETVHAQYRTQPGDEDARWWQASFPDVSNAPQLDRLDALILCAGVCPLGPVSEFDRAVWAKTMAVNLYAPAELTAFYLPALRATGGHVIYVNSGAGLRANPNWGAYAASKFAAKAWCDALRAEEPGIRVTSVYPGRIDTPMQREVVAWENGTYNPGAYLSARTVAWAVLGALDTPADGHPHDVVLRPRG